jgi:hypothetical protein
MHPQFSEGRAALWFLVGALLVLAPVSLWRCTVVTASRDAVVLHPPHGRMWLDGYATYGNAIAIHCGEHTIRMDEADPPLTVHVPCR